MYFYFETFVQNILNSLNFFSKHFNIFSNLCDSQRRQFEMVRFLVSCVMRKNVSIILAKDNIDFHARSADAKSHYHVTSFFLSIIQFKQDMKTNKPKLKT